MIENVQQCANNIASVTGDVYGTRVDIAEIREQYQELMNEVQGTDFSSDFLTRTQFQCLP